jgi:hypothetical protein
MLCISDLFRVSSRLLFAGLGFGLLQAVFRRAQDLRRRLLEALKGGFSHNPNITRYAGGLQ